MGPKFTTTLEKALPLCRDTFGRETAERNWDRGVTLPSSFGRGTLAVILPSACMTRRPLKRPNSGSGRLALTTQSVLGPLRTTRAATCIGCIATSRGPGWRSEGRKDPCLGSNPMKRAVSMPCPRTGEFYGLVPASFRTALAIAALFTLIRGRRHDFGRLFLTAVFDGISAAPCR